MSKTKWHRWCRQY